MNNAEAARILSAILKKQQELPEKHRDLDNREMLAMSKAIKTLRLYHGIQSSKKNGRKW